MAKSPIKVASENDVTPPAEETLDFDDDNLRGEQIRCCFFLEELISMTIGYIVLDVFIKWITLMFWKLTSNKFLLMHFVATFFLSCCKLERSRSIFVLAIAEVFKNQGNEEYGKRDFVNAIHFYTEGIKVACKDKELNAKLYSNRATAHFYLGKNVCISFGILEMSRAF